MARADCTATVERVVDDEPPVLGMLTFDPNGDETLAQWPDGDIRTEYGNPHERVLLDLGSLVVRFAWSEGRLLETSVDYDGDGTLEIVQRATFDDRGLWTTETWDLDGDGLTDQRTDWSWAADGTAWHGLGVGDPPSSSEAWAEASGFVTRYTYASGDLSTERIESVPNALGLSAHRSDTATNTSTNVLLDERVTDMTFDALGRADRVVDSLTTSLPTETTVDTLTYACP